MDAFDPLFAIVSLDFKAKVHAKCTLESFRREMEAGKFVWIDVDISQSEEARKLVASLNLCAPEIVEDAMSREPATQIARYDDYIHLVLSGCRLIGHKFDLERVDAMMGENFLLTLHKGQPIFLEAVRKSYVTDFVRFAQSPSFLLYELGSPDRQLPRRPQEVRRPRRARPEATDRRRRGFDLCRGKRARLRSASPAQGRVARACGVDRSVIAQEPVRQRSDAALSREHGRHDRARSPGRAR
jgi:hypothetical protein